MKYHHGKIEKKCVSIIAFISFCTQQQKEFMMTHLMQDEVDCMRWKKNNHVLSLSYLTLLIVKINHQIEIVLNPNLIRHRKNTSKWTYLPQWLLSMYTFNTFMKLDLNTPIKILVAN